MAAAKSVVATGGGVSEAISENETDFLVASNDEEALANRLIKLLENPEK